MLFFYAPNYAKYWREIMLNYALGQDYAKLCFHKKPMARTQQNTARRCRGPDHSPESQRSILHIHDSGLIASGPDLLVLISGAISSVQGHVDLSSYSGSDLLVLITGCDIIRPRTCGFIFIS